MLLRSLRQLHMRSVIAFSKDGSLFLKPLYIQHLHTYYVDVSLS
jgi:hypothetical protein